MAEEIGVQEGGGGRLQLARTPTEGISVRACSITLFQALEAGGKANAKMNRVKTGGKGDGR